MNDDLLQKIIDWMNFSIENQEGLKIENEPMEFPQWNKGYLECLQDLKNLFTESSHE